MANVPVRLTAGAVPDALRGADGTELTVPATMGRKALRNVVQHLCGLADSDPVKLPDVCFIVEDFGPLRTTLEKFLTRRNLTAERTVRLTYYVPLPEPETGSSVSVSKEWLAALAVGDWSGEPEAVIGSFSGCPLVSREHECVLDEAHTKADGHGGAIKAVAWLPTGNEFVSAGHDETAKVWRYDRAAGEAVAIAAFRPGQIGEGVAFESAAAANVGGKDLIALGGADGSLWVVDEWRDSEVPAAADRTEHSGDDDALNKNEAESTEQNAPPHKRKRPGPADVGARHVGTATRDLPIAKCCWSGNELITAGFDGMLRYWNVESCTTTVSVPCGGKAVTGAAVSDAVCYVSCADGRIRGVESRGRGGVVSVSERGKGHNGVVSDISWIRSGVSFASCGVDGTVRTWDVRSPSIPAHTVEALHGKGHRSLRIGGIEAKDRATLFSVGTDGALRTLNI